MAVPVQPPVERLQRALPLPASVTRRALDLFLPAPCGLGDLAQRQRAPRNVRRQARTLLGSRGRARHRRPIVPPARRQERLQSLQAGFPAARLSLRAVIRRESQVARSGNAAWLDPRRTAQTAGRRRQGFAHDPVPAPAPAASGPERAGDPTLGQFVPGYAVCAAPGADSSVPGVGPLVAGFLVRPERRDACTVMQLVENAIDVADAHNKRRA